MLGKWKDLTLCRRFAALQNDGNAKDSERLVREPAQSLSEGIPSILDQDLLEKIEFNLVIWSTLCGPGSRHVRDI